MQGGSRESFPQIAFLCMCEFILGGMEMIHTNSSWGRKSALNLTALNARWGNIA